MPHSNQDGAELIIDGRDALRAILSGIREAHSTIRIRAYMWRDDTSGRMILDALSEKIVRNPSIRIIIQKDAFGSRVYDFQKWISFRKIGGDIFSSSYGIEFLKQIDNVSFSFVGSRSVLFFKYLKENDHSKVFLFDEHTPESIAIIGGMNISDDYLTEQNHGDPDSGGSHDYMVRLHGSLTQDIATPEKRERGWILLRKVRAGAEILIDIQNKHTIRQEILRELSKAKVSVDVEHGYITDRAIIRKLREISERGVHVRIIVSDRSDGVWHANMRSIEKLLRPWSEWESRLDTHLEVYLYIGKIHAKVIVIDSSTAIIGSANLTYGSFDLLKETNAIFRQRNGVVESLLTQFEKDIHYCKKIQHANVPSYRESLAWIQDICI